MRRGGHGALLSGGLGAGEVREGQGAVLLRVGMKKRARLVFWVGARKEAAVSIAARGR